MSAPVRRGRIVRSPRCSGLGLRTTTIAAALLAAVILGAAVPSLAQEEIRRLLEELGIDPPARALIAPLFSLQDVAGAPVRLRDYQDRIVMLYFWATW